MSQVVPYKDKRPVVAKAYAPGGCPIPLGKQKCGETQGLDIIMDFHKLYQEKMNEIDVSAGGDSLQEKVDLQEQWIEDLTAQNKLLARVIEELESETIGRVQQLEDKLNNAVKSFGEDGKPALPENEKNPEEIEDKPKALPLEDVQQKPEESDHLKEENQYKQTAEMLSSIAEVNEQEVILTECIISNISSDKQRKKEYINDNPKDPFEEFVRDIKAQSSPPRPESREIPRCKDYCYLWRLFSEFTALKLQTNLKDELLAQQLNIIKVLATRLFIMETCLKKLGKTPEEIIAEELMSGKML